MGTNTGTRDRTGREYLRVSYDRSGRERSQNEQHDDNARACTEHAITLATPYRESGSASASRYARKSRDDFARLLADLESGRFGANVLVLWESSRGSRKVGEWVTLIELCEDQGVSIFVTTHGREYDPGNARDRRSLLEDAVDSEYESSKVSARARRASAANAAAGKPHGRVPFGYQRRYDERTKAFLAQEPHPDQAPIVREVFIRVRAGHSLRAIARDFEARGFVNRSGRPFTAAHLRVLALTASYAGVRLHDPEGKRTGRRVNVYGAPGVQQTPGTWPALVSLEESWPCRRSCPTRSGSPPARGRRSTCCR
jgi:site-specific DNA recombinase